MLLPTTLHAAHLPAETVNAVAQKPFQPIASFGEVAGGVGGSSGPTAGVRSRVRARHQLPEPIPLLRPAEALVQKFVHTYKCAVDDSIVTVGSVRCRGSVACASGHVVRGGADEQLQPSSQLQPSRLCRL